ncbi:hypothetical protein ACWA5Z_10780 [Testudinibacter sp. P80/BLE/0925]|uniref:hypothetical protein n=1 Tax=Testudinibacter sp. TW-1 TaxID=3417757 RepID=UPI003D362ECA
MTNTEYKPTLTGVLKQLSELQEFISPVLAGKLPEVRGIEPPAPTREMTLNEVIGFIADKLTFCEMDLDKIQQELIALYGENPTNSAQKGA